MHTIANARSLEMVAATSWVERPCFPVACDAFPFAKSRLRRNWQFNANRVIQGDLFLVRDPLQALTAHESGIENVVAFLTENVTALQLEQLAVLMDERKCEHLEMF